ncbi:MAG TPA: hypothetical protein VKA84_14620 [Gemmatimonadaceae bacterium]|nr:hypothetical protein [Gemmatimonadaceae bacterium]
MRHFRGRCSRLALLALMACGAASCVPPRGAGVEAADAGGLAPAAVAGCYALVLTHWVTADGRLHPAPELPAAILLDSAVLPDRFSTTGRPVRVLAPAPGADPAGRIAAIYRSMQWITAGRDSVVAVFTHEIGGVAIVFRAGGDSLTGTARRISDVLGVEQPIAAAVARRTPCAADDSRGR